MISKFIKTKIVIFFLFVTMIGFFTIDFEFNHAKENDIEKPMNFYPNFSWGETPIQLVSNESDLISMHPFVFIDGNDIPHITWADNSDIFGALPGMCNIFYSYYDSATPDWTGYFDSTDVIFQDPLGDFYPPAIVIDSQENIHIAFTVFTDLGGSGSDCDIYYVYYNTTTANWGGRVNSSYDIISTESVGESFIPRMCVDQDDTVYIVWTDFSAISGALGQSNIFFKHFNAQLGQWTGFANQTDVISNENIDHVWIGDITCDVFNKLHVTWIDNSIIDYTIKYKHYDEPSQQWIGNVNSTDIISSDCPDTSAKPNIVTDKNGFVHIAWLDWSDVYGAGIGRDILYRYWDGISWKGHINSTDVISTLSTDEAWHVVIELDPLGNLHFVWQDSTDILGSGLDWDIFHRYWNTKTNEYSHINLVSENLDGKSWRPDFKIDTEGNLHFCWQDNSNITVTPEGFDPILTGIDDDIFYKKYNYIPDIPDAPYLELPIALPDGSGEHYFEWTGVFSATEYRLYRDTTNISDVVSLTPLATTDLQQYNDLPPKSGTYYYVVTAFNSAGESAISNVRSITVTISKPKPSGLHFLSIISLAGLALTVYIFHRKFKK